MPVPQLLPKDEEIFRTVKVQSSYSIIVGEYIVYMSTNFVTLNERLDVHGGLAI
jgi:hypothetical protein